MPAGREILPGDALRALCYFFSMKPVSTWLLLSGSLGANTRPDIELPLPSERESESC